MTMTVKEANETLTNARVLAKTLGTYRKFKTIEQRNAERKPLSKVGGHYGVKRIREARNGEIASDAAKGMLCEYAGVRFIVEQRIATKTQRYYILRTVKTFETWKGEKCVIQDDTLTGAIGLMIGEINRENCKLDEAASHIGTVQARRLKRWLKECDIQDTLTPTGKPNVRTHVYKTGEFGNAWSTVRTAELDGGRKEALLAKSKYIKLYGGGIYTSIEG